MSSLCNFMDHPEWTPEQRTAVALVETLRMKRNEEEQARAARNHARATSPLTVSGAITPPSCANPGTVSTPLPAAEDSALHPLDADDTDAGNPPLRGWKLAGVIAGWSAAMAFTTWLAGWLP